MKSTSHLRLIRGGLSQERAAQLALYPPKDRKVRAEPKPNTSKYTRPIPPDYRPAA